MSRAGFLFKPFAGILPGRPNLLNSTAHFSFHLCIRPWPTHTMDMSDMSMASPTMVMATSTASPTIHMTTTTSMADGPMSSGMMMSMADMAMVFFTSANTPLHTQAWTPTTASQYVGTCIFLVILPIICRALLVLRCRFPALMERLHAHKHNDIISQLPDDIDECKQLQTPSRPWSINESLLRGILDTILAAVGYLL